MNKGKKKCEILKTIRCQVAKKNGIPYTYTECTYQGECRGTCPKCEEELRYLTRELDKIKRSGKQVAVAGVAAAVIATSATGCSSGFLAELGIGEQEQQIAGAMAAPEELDGDVAYIPPEPEETESLLEGEVPEECVTAGEPLPVLPAIGDVIADLRLSGDAYVGAIERTTIQVEWAQWLTGSGEDYDIFTVDGDQIIVTYHEDGWSDSVALYAEITTEDAQ